MPASDSTYCDVIEKMSRDYDALKAHADAMAAALEPFAAEHEVIIEAGEDPTVDLEDAACALDAYRKWLEGDAPPSEKVDVVKRRNPVCPNCNSIETFPDRDAYGDDVYECPDCMQSFML